MASPVRSTTSTSVITGVLTCRARHVVVDTNDDGDEPVGRSIPRGTDPLGKRSGWGTNAAL